MPRLPSNITVDKSEVSQTFDLEELTGVNLSSNSNLKQSIGQALIDKIADRTSKGKDIRGESFNPYPKSYKESDQYSAFNKTAKVNMNLSGGMISNIDIIDDSGSSIKLGWSDSVENAKAFNHMTGDTVRQRQFFGLTREDAESVINQFSDQIDELREEPSDPLGSFISQVRNGGFGAPIRQAATTAAATITLRELFGEDDG